MLASSSWICGKYDQQFQQLAFDVKAVLPAAIHAFCFGVVILKKFELDKKKMQINYSSGEEQVGFEGPISGQIPIFAPSQPVSDSNSLRSELVNLDISRITPLEAMNILYSLIEKAKGDD